MAAPQNWYAGGVLMITFEKPLLLLLLLCIVPGCILFLYRLHNLMQRYTPDSRLQQLARTLKIRMVLWSISWSFLCLAVAVPLWGTRQVSTVKFGNTVVFAVDVSRSMMITDTPPNRLEFAKQYVTFLIDRLPETVCGLVTVKGQGVLAVPLSYNHESIVTAIEALSTFSSTAAGSNLEHGLRTALAAFQKNRLTGKTIVLCTDGDETAGSLFRILPQLRQENIQLIIIGFGTSEGGSISVLNEKYESVQRQSSLSDAVLKRAAQQTLNGSFYISALEPGSARKVLQALQEGGEYNEKIHYIQKPVRRAFECITAALLFFCAGFFTGGFYGKKDI